MAVISDLEENCLLEIFRKIPGRKNSFNHALVCRLWRRLSYEALTSITFDEGKRCRVLLSLLNFPNLTSLEFHDNSLAWTSDPILEVLSRYCPKLVYLRIGDQGYGANFGEPGLKAIFRGCKKLQVFQFQPLTRSPVIIPEALGLSTQLKSLTFGNWSKGCWDDSNLESLPHALGKLTNLEELVVASDRLGCVPDTVGELVNLKRLKLRSMELATLPPTFWKMSALTSLELQCMMLRSLSDSIDQLSLLSSMTLEDCHSLTYLPNTIGNLTNLTSLKISSCDDLIGLPASFAKLTSLESLHVSSCGHFFSLPENFGLLRGLKDLFIDVFEEFQALPAQIGDLCNLQALHLSAPGLTELPESFGRLTALATLELEGCQALRRLPFSLGGLSSLTDLTVTDCPALYSLPESFLELTNLKLVKVVACCNLILPKSGWTPVYDVVFVDCY